VNGASVCFPFNCAGVNTGTGTNSLDCRRVPDGTYNGCHSASSRSTMAKIEELADRVDRLILRHDELQRTNALLEQQLGAVTHERDSLRSRLNAARSRIDALLERLPAEPATSAAAADGTGSAA
jgi:uncharacterized protein (TIGR02449 family)